MERIHVQMQKIENVFRNMVLFTTCKIKKNSLQTVYFLLNSLNYVLITFEPLQMPKTKEEKTEE